MANCPSKETVTSDVFGSHFRNSDVRIRSRSALKPILFSQGTINNGFLIANKPAKPWNGAAHTCLVVVVLVPIAIRVPAAVVLIPPLMPLTPATLPRIVQFTTLVICLFAVASVFLDCLVEFMLRVSNSALTSVLVFCLKARHGGAKQNCCKSD
jgi:hypothetical protein